MIPRRVFWFFDASTVVLAFVVAHLASPVLQTLVGPGSYLRAAAAEILVLPPVELLGDFRPMRELVWVLVVMLVTTFLCMHAFDGYRPILRQTRTLILASSLASALGGAAFVTMVLFALRSGRWSRLHLFSFALFTFVGLSGYRLALRWYRRKRAARGHYARNVALVGPPESILWMQDHFRRNVRPSEYRLFGYFDLDVRDDGGPVTHGLQRLGPVRDAGDVLIHQPIHEIIAVQPASDSSWMHTLIEACDYFRVTLRVVPEALLASSLKDLQVLYRQDPLRLPEVVLQPPSIDSDRLFLKRMIDIVVSAALLALLSPLFLVIAVLIKLTSPNLPVFYRWRVVGYKGEVFTGYKFTTMHADADARKQALLHRNEMQGPVFKMKDDPRITPLGRFLRKHSLNELPQLWSVLKGDMSLVGPRPAFPHELQRYELWHKRKLSVKPGITCLWQVRGRNRITSFDDWVRMDLEYIDNWSLWLDLKILGRTAWAVVAGTGY